MAKRRKPTDSTLRNVRASRKADAALEKQLDGLHGLIVELRHYLDLLAHRVYKLESGKDVPFATKQRELGYRHSTAPKHQLRVKER